MSPAGFPLGLPSMEIAARSKESGPAHMVFKAFYVAESRKLRVLASLTSGDIAASYKRLSRDAAKFAAAHHRLARMEVGK